MRIYGLPYREIMAIPVKAFWALNGYVYRLREEENLDQLRVSRLAQISAEDLEPYIKAMKDAAPDPVVYSGKAVALASAQRDDEGFEQLRTMAG